MLSRTHAVLVHCDDTVNFTGSILCNATQNQQSRNTNHVCSAPGGKTQALSQCTSAGNTLTPQPLVMMPSQMRHLSTNPDRGRVTLGGMLLAAAKHHSAGPLLAALESLTNIAFVASVQLAYHAHRAIQVRHVPVHRSTDLEIPLQSDRLATHHCLNCWLPN